MTELLKENDFLRSSDIALVSALGCYGYTIEAVDKVRSKATFLIRRDRQLDNIIQQFWAGQLRVEPLAYFNQLKAIKTRIYNIND